MDCRIICVSIENIAAAVLRLHLRIFIIVGKITDWMKQTPGELKKWHEKIPNNELW
jgi:hypothetical protein